MFDLDELADLTALATKIARLDERLIADHDLMLVAKRIEEARRFLDGAQGAVLAELDVRGTTDIVSGMRTQQWLARETGVAPGVAYGRVAVANTIRESLPGTDAAVRDGRLCHDRAKVMASVVNERIATEFRAMEESLIAESARMTFPQWSQRVRLVAALLDEDGPEPADDISNNRLNLRGGVDGTHLGGVFVGDLAVTARHALELMADELWRQFTADADATNGAVSVPKRATLLALAFAELCRRGLMVDVNGNALTVPKVEATLMINADEPDVVYVDGEPLARWSDTALACDLSVWAIVLDSLGVPLDMGREIRTANKAQRRALKCRDGGCAFPGCARRPEHCDAHHVARWHRDLGSTNVRHMVFLCRHHHSVIHRRGWEIQIGDDGWCWITTPDGTSLWCQRHGGQRAGPAPPLAA